jgi:hypothetical protein
MIRGGISPLFEGVRLHFRFIQGMVMDRCAFLREAASSNNRVNSDNKKRRSFVALLFAAGYAKR